MVHRSMAMLANTSLAVDGRGAEALDEHEAMVKAIEDGEEDAAATTDALAGRSERRGV